VWAYWLASGMTGVIDYDHPEKTIVEMREFLAKYGRKS